LRVVAYRGQPYAVLAECLAGRFLLPPAVQDLAGNVVDGPVWVAGIDPCSLGIELPVVRVRTVGELAAVDQRLAALRSDVGAQPWPLLDPRDDPGLGGPCQLRGRIGRPNLRLGAVPGEEAIWDITT
jgi:hypothetical protein